MFYECRKFLIDKLKESGIRMEPITSTKKLNTYTDSHVGAVLFHEENLNRNGSKRLYEDQTGAARRRRKIFDRNLSFGVVIGEYDPQKAEIIYEEFLRNLGSGLYIDGNFIYAEPSDAEWAEGEDSILKAKIAVQLKVTFSGGVYRDTDYLDIGGKQLDIKTE
ncbi:MAG: SON protein [Hungatella sp.]|jgi:hypothetical protein|nr:SON protein [Hungatella sp.]